MSSEQRAASNDLLRVVCALIEGESNVIANMANTAAQIGLSVGEINWAGFYLWDGTELVLGPFWGKPACIRIGLGRGVCGTAAAERRTIIVPDVHAFPGHIACDDASRSEIVVPMIVNNNVVGVLDIDSPSLDRFTNEDASTFEAIVNALVTTGDWSHYTR